MKAEDLYFMRGEEDEEGGFYLVTKEFWEANHYIDDNEMSRKFWNILPKMEIDGEFKPGFSQESESYFQYYEEGLVQNDYKGLEILKSLGIKEVFMSYDVL